MVVFSVAALLACLVLSLAIEFAQLWFPSRVASPKDVAAEALGGLLGTLAWLLIGSPIVNARNERLRHVVSPVSRYAPGEVGRPNPLDTPEGANRVRWVWVLAAAIYSAGLCGYYWDPYDWTTDEEFVAYRSDRFWRLPFSSLQAEGYLKAMREMTRKVVSFLPLGVFCTLASRQLSSRWTRIAWGLVFGFGVGTTVELGQLFLPSRFPEVTDALLCGAGAGVGMLLSSLRFRMRSRRHAPVQ
jgi:VanZ family protein